LLKPAYRRWALAAWILLIAVFAAMQWRQSAWFAMSAGMADVVWYIGIPCIGVVLCSSVGRV